MASIVCIACIAAMAFKRISRPGAISVLMRLWMHRAWAKRDAVQRERLLPRLAHDLEHEGRSDAAGSLREASVLRGGPVL